MKDVTFVICVRIDSQARLDNLDFSIAFLQEHFPSNIILVEEDETSKIEGRYKDVTYIFIKSLFPIFQRTRLMNKAVNELVRTSYFCLYDMDVFIDPETYVKAVEYLREYSVVYPFDGRFYEIPQKYNKIKELKVSDIADGDKTMINFDSVGGAIFFRTTDFIRGGMENEFFLGWGHEDGERFVRFGKLGYRIKRMDNPMYHFTHPRGINSSGRNPNVRANEAEFMKVSKMTKGQLVEYIDNVFHWCKMRRIIKISIVIPCYEMGGKGVEFLRYNIGRILEQSFTHYEIIISDHSINDDIKNLVGAYLDERIVYIKNPYNRGSSSANLNYGITHAQGPIIKPMFQDDYFCSHRALDIIHNAFLTGHPWLAVASNNTEDRISYSKSFYPTWNDEMVYGKNTISSPSCVAYLKDNEITWDERLIWLMDVSFYHRMKQKHGIPYFENEVLVTNFGHPGQVSRTIGNERKEWEVSLMHTEYPTKEDIERREMEEKNNSDNQV